LLNNSIVRVSLKPTLVVVKTLYIVRHAKSSWDDPSLPDRKRPLNKRGFKNAHELANCIKISNYKVDMAYSSPAKRALNTAEIICDKLEITQDQFKVHDGFYPLNYRYLFQFIQNLDNSLEAVLIVGHEPALSQFVNHFLETPLEKLVTGSLTKLDFDVAHWRDVRPSSILKIHHLNRHYWSGVELK